MRTEPHPADPGWGQCGEELDSSRVYGLCRYWEQQENP
jgi:hypothetical protein